MNHDVPDAHFLVDFKVERHLNQLTDVIEFSMKALCEYCLMKVQARLHISMDMLTDIEEHVIYRLTRNIVYAHTTPSLRTKNIDYAISLNHKASAITAGELKVINNIKSKYSIFDPGEYSIFNPGKVSKKEQESTELSYAALELPGVNYHVKDCPSRDCEGKSGPIRRMIMHLNDDHRWTRESIADWLENIHDPTGLNGPNLNFQLEEEV